MNLYPLIAEKIERDPALVDEALRTARRWIAEGLQPLARLREWENLLLRAQAGEDGLRQLLHLLRDDSEEARRLKDFGPFPGLLSRSERRSAIVSCVYDH
jgi:hypothetical protein